MSENNPGSDFLKNKYDLHNAPEVAKTAHHTEVTTGEEIVETDAEALIQNYLDRYAEAISEPDTAKRARHIEAIKRMLHSNFVIKPSEIPEAYFDHQKEMAREQGHGDIEITDEMRSQLTEVIITDQETTLDNWIDYLASEDATYPDWLKYYAIRSVLGIGGFDKERHAFSKRSKGTTKPFPDLNREALAYVLDTLEKKYSKEGVDLSSLTEDEQKEFQKLLTGENFAKLYAWAIEKVTPASVEQITITEGKWVKFPKGTDPTSYIPEGFDKPLVESLQGHGTGWCTAGESTAKVQLENGDFYVYYSLDQQGQPIIPRVAIRMQGDQIGEVRGIAADQNLDPYIGDVVAKKMEEFPDGKLYEKKVADMKFLTTIDKKTKAGQELSKEELIFLYEIDSKIQGFGYQDDPRIKEIRDKRNPKEDAPIVLECEPQEIAWSESEINKNTKSYIGPLFPNIFARFAHLEHIYTTFPETEIHRGEVTTEGKSGPQYEIELRDRQIHLYGNSKFMLKSREFTITPAGENIPTVRLKVRDLFSDGNIHTYSEILTRANELGLDFLPHEIGPDLLLKEETQPKMGEWYRVVTKPISDQNGNPGVFRLGRSGGGLRLSNGWADPDDKWNPDGEFVFGLRKLESSET